MQATAEAFLLFLSFTKDPVVPFEIHDACIAAANNYQNCRLVRKSEELRLNETFFSERIIY